MGTRELDLLRLSGPIRAGMQDYDSLIELVDECFPGDKQLGGMLPRWPHCFRKDRIQNSLIIKDGARVIGHVGCVDQTVLFREGQIRVAGISGVATKPEYRGKGVMTSILLYTEEFLRREGYLISDLGGSRQRYGRFGWELGGRVWQFNVTPRSLGAVGEPSGFGVEKYSRSLEEVRMTLMINRRQRLGVKRDRTLHALLLGRLGKEVLLARRRGVLDSYAVIERREKWAHIGEYAGTADGVHAILLHLTESLGVESAVVPSPWSHPINQRLREVSSGWQVNCLRSIKIIDLPGTLKAFSRQISRKYGELGLRGTRVLILGIEGEPVAAKLKFSPDGASVSRTRTRKDAIILPRREMVQFVFGPEPPSSITNLPSGASFVEVVFPLDFHIWHNEMV